MSFRGKLWVLVISGAIAVYAVVGGLPAVGWLLTTSAQQPVSDASAQLKIVESVLQHIQNDYVDEPNMEKVRMGALRGLAGGLDPYSAYLTPEQVKAFEANKAASRNGIGVEFSQISGYLYVVSSIKGSPAEKAGVKTGDVIEYIDGKATKDISLYDAKLLINGESGTALNLRILRAGEKPQTIKVVRGSYQVPKAEMRVEGGRVGVIKVHTLGEGEANEIRTHVTSLTKSGIQKIILDLRGVAAGTIAEAASVANLFVKEGELAKIVGRENKVQQTFTADPAKAIFDGGLAVLTDVGTAGAGEVVASAILERKRGEVIGERTFGAGTEQKLFTMTNGGGYLLTVAKWASASGAPFLGEERATMGVKPSIEVKRPDTPEPLDIEGLTDNQNEQNPSPTATPTPKPVQPKVVEDIHLKKALEVLGEKPTATKAAE